MPTPAKIVSIKCPLCERDYPLNESLMHSAFACLNCGTLIRASGLREASSARSRDTKPISRGDTMPIDIGPAPPRRAMPSLEDIANEAAGRPVTIRRAKPPSKHQKLLAKASIVAVCGAVAMLLIVVVGSLASKAIRAPTSVLPPPSVHVTLETPQQRDRRVAWEHVERLQGEIAANNREVSRLLTALREATSKHFAPTQKELVAARERAKELASQEAKWKAEYDRLSRETGL